MWVLQQVPPPHSGCLCSRPAQTWCRQTFGLCARAVRSLARVFSALLHAAFKFRPSYLVWLNRFEVQPLIHSYAVGKPMPGYGDVPCWSPAGLGSLIRPWACLITTDLPGNNCGTTTAPPLFLPHRSHGIATLVGKATVLPTSPSASAPGSLHCGAAHSWGYLMAISSETILWRQTRSSILH